MSKFDKAFQKYKEEKELTLEEKEIILLDVFYFLEDENRHFQIELLESLTNYSYKELEKKHGNIF